MEGLQAPPLPTVHTLGRVSTRGVDEKNALRSFEAYVVGEMLRQAAPSNEGGILSGGQAGRMYQEHLYQEFARLIAERGNFGLAKQLEGQLSKPDPSDGAERTDGEAGTVGPAVPRRRGEARSVKGELP